MTPEEFTSRTGIKPCEAEYKEIETMYLECGGEIDKDKFCDDYKKHRNSILLYAFFNQSEKLKNKLDDFRDERARTVDFMLERAQKFGDIELLKYAINLIGHAKVIKRKIHLNLPLWDIDREYILDNLQ